MTGISAQDTVSDDVDRKLDSILAAQNTHYQQNEQLLLMSIQQQNLLTQIVQVVNAQSQMINDINQKFASVINKLSDMELYLNQSDDVTQNIQQDIQQNFESVNRSIEDIKQMLKELRVYGTLES